MSTGSLIQKGVGAVLVQTDGEARSSEKPRQWAGPTGPGGPDALSGLLSSPSFHIHVLSEPQNGTLFENRVLADVIKRCSPGLEQVLNSMTGVHMRRGEDRDTYTHTPAHTWVLCYGSSRK